MHACNAHAPKTKRLNLYLSDVNLPECEVIERHSGPHTHRDDTNILSTYYITLVDSYTALVVVFSGKRAKNDKLVNDFLQGT